MLAALASVMVFNIFMNVFFKGNNNQINMIIISWLKRLI